MERFRGQDLPRPLKPHDDPGLFLRMYPSETAGDGRIVENNLRTGEGQGRGGTRRKAPCRQCGFPLDTAKVDTSGGDEGASEYAVTKDTATGTTARGDSLSEPYGDSGRRQGCPNCGSRNGSLVREPKQRALVAPILGF